MRLYFDTNSANADGRYWLSCAGTLRDLELLAVELEAGMPVTLYMEDPDEEGHPALLLVDAVVERDGEHFVARADDRTRRHERMSLVSRVRRLAREEWSLLRDIRLAALTDAPDQFGETHLLAARRSAEEWTALTCSDMPGAAFGTYVAEVDGTPVGMAFAIQDKTDAATGRLGGMWVAPNARGIGVGMSLVRAVLDWSRNGGLQRVSLWVVPSTAAERLYRRAQFTPTGAHKPFPGDDSRSVIEMQLELGNAT